MAKVFTITEGLENMGALKTGGQGSVYKGRRIGEIFTAIKILPTPIYSESTDDKNFIAFQNEVQKLKKVNETPDPNVVKILNFGITDSGSFPFIEMEFIEGPDLAELLMPPRDPVFTIKEVLKVAEQLSNALAHCHTMDVKHGDIKSNNIKFNNHTGNYVLLDFGLAMMSDEQRRTSLRHAGAIEFMAPEQNEGKMLFETDIYSFGVILFELLAGSVPFLLADKGETARNMVMLAHMETLPPNPLILRHQALPNSWSEEKKEHEMHVPNYLLNMIYTCLQKRPSDRFSNGMELHDYFVTNSINTDNNETVSARVSSLLGENKMLINERDQLQKKLLFYEDSKIKKDIAGTAGATTSVQPGPSSRKGILLASVVILMLCVFAYVVLKKNADGNKDPTNISADSTNMKSNFTHAHRTDSTVISAESIISKLSEARTDLNNNDLAKATNIYNDLAKQEIPEAMYEYANLALQNNNDRIDCKSAFSMLLKAASKGYTPAKRTAGFLYAFANDDALLTEQHYNRCTFTRNVPEGAKLLMEAMLDGDAAASGLLDELNSKNNNEADQDSNILHN